VVESKRPPACVAVAQRTSLSSIAYTVPRLGIFQFSPWRLRRAAYIHIYAPSRARALARFIDSSGLFTPAPACSKLLIACVVTDRARGRRAVFRTMREGLISPIAGDSGTASLTSCSSSFRLRALLGALIAGAVVTHLVLLGMLMSEHSGHVSSAMVYCEVDGDDLAHWSDGSVCTSTSPEGSVACVDGTNVDQCYGNDVGVAIIGSFEWKVSYALAQDCTILGSQLATGGDGKPRQPMLCPAAMQADTKQQGRCKVPVTPCECPQGVAT
jgi:hypothetical protein